LALTQTATDPESIVKAIQFDTLKSRQNDILNALHVDPTQQYAEGGQVKTPRIPTRNTRFIDPEAETNRGMSALEALRGYFGAPSQASVMRPGMSSAYSGGELAAAAHDKEFADKVGVSQSVAKEFNDADSKKSVKKSKKGDK
jgi:hypothetical protein